MLESAMTRTFHLISAARPNFMKIAPVYHALKAADWCEPVIIHTGQHYDANMSDSFFEDLGLPTPDYNLEVGSGTHAQQTGAVMIAYEKIIMDTPPDATIVVGDVNSTIACTLAAKKLCLTVAHLEAGLRSRDWEMPEEINRIVTDTISDILWTPSPDGDENLLSEGVAPSRITRVGNVMLDSYELMRPRIEAETPRKDFGLDEKGYGIVTLHRPSNVDRKKTLAPLVEALKSAAARIPLLFPLHPRTRKNLETYGLLDDFLTAPGVHVSEPINYIRFMGQAIGHPQLDLVALWKQEHSGGLARALELLHTALPNVPDPLFGQRFGLSFELIVHSLADREKLRSSAKNTFEVDAALFVNNLIDCIAGAMSATVSKETQRELKRLQQKNP